MKSLRRVYTTEFREDAVRQVIDGRRPLATVARGLEISRKTLENWVRRARLGQPVVKVTGRAPVTELEAEVQRLRVENAKLRMEREILKNLRLGGATSRWQETRECSVAILI